MTYNASVSESLPQAQVKLPRPAVPAEANYPLRNTHMYKLTLSHANQFLSILITFRIPYKISFLFKFLSISSVVLYVLKSLWEYITNFILNHTHPFNSPFSGTTRVSRYQKGKRIWILLKQETVSSSGISWAICKSAPCSRQITMPAPHHSVFYRPDAFPATQPTASKHWGRM